MDRLSDHDNLLFVCTWHRLVPEKIMKNANAFLEAGRSMPAWVAGLAFISTNLGALEVMGMTGSGNEIWNAYDSLLLDRSYSSHGISGSVYDAILLWSKARSVPEFLKLRYDEKNQGIECNPVCCHDCACIRYLNVCISSSYEKCSWMEF